MHMLHAMQYRVDGRHAGGTAVSVRQPSSASLAEHTTPTGQLGAVRIARRVLRTVVEQAALGVPGVARMASIRDGWQRSLGRPLPQHGVGLVVRGEIVGIDLYVVIAADANMVDVGAGVQEAVAAAVEHILGMGISEINVYIQDVD